MRKCVPRERRFPSAPKLVAVVHSGRDIRPGCDSIRHGKKDPVPLRKLIGEDYPISRAARRVENRPAGSEKHVIPTRDDRFAPARSTPAVGCPMMDQSNII